MQCCTFSSKTKFLCSILANVAVLLLPLLFLCHITQWINKYWIIFRYNFSSSAWGLSSALIYILTSEHISSGVLKYLLLVQTGYISWMPWCKKQQIKTYTIRKCLFQLYTKQLTPWSRTPLEKLMVVHLVEKFSAFYGTCKSTTIFTIACHQGLPSARYLRTNISSPTHASPHSLPTSATLIWLH